MIYYYHKDAIHISRIDLYVSNLEISKEFYTNQLGFSILKEDKHMISLSVDHEHEILCLHENQNLELKHTENNIYHFAILLPTRKDLGNYLHHLIRKQIPIDGAADHLVSEAIYLQDPDGIGIEISCDKDDSTWFIKEDFIDMDTLPFDYKGVYYAADDQPFTTLPIDTIIGHLHLQVSDIEKIKKFYQDVIGFKITNEEMKDAIFLSDKNYHHHLAINTWNKQSKKINQMKSFTITYPNCEKFVKTIDQIKKLKLNYQEINQGYLIKDPENTEIILRIK